MIVEDWKRDELFCLFSKRTNRKNKENYIVNAIWHRLGNLNLQPVTQQCIRFSDDEGKKKRALIDLYFPQINYGVECDEEYHQKNPYADLERTYSIEQALAAVDVGFDFTLKRIDASASIIDIDKAIAETVSEIKDKIKKLKTPLKWKSVAERIDDVIKRGVLYDSDLIPFRTQASAGPCFDRYPEQWQKSYFALNDQYQIWFPKLALEIEGELIAQSNVGWINKLEQDGDELRIIEYNDSKDTSETDKYREKLRVTFAKSKDVYGNNAYRFMGVFRYKGTDKEGHNIYFREARHIDLGQFRK